MKSKGGVAGDAGQDPSYVRQAFAKIAPRYVLTNHVLSLGIDILWRKFTAKKVREVAPSTLLDLATGSGDLAFEILKQNPGIQLLGADFSAPMLREAHLAGLPHVMVADAMNLPLADESFEAVSVAFGLRNMAHWAAAIQEMSRVLVPNGTLFVLDFSLPTHPLLKRLYGWYLRHVMTTVAGWLTGEKAAYQYLCGSIEKFPAGAAMVKMLTENGFKSAEYHALSFGVATLYIARKGAR